MQKAVADDAAFTIVLTVIYDLDRWNSPDWRGLPRQVRWNDGLAAALEDRFYYQI